MIRIALFVTKKRKESRDVLEREIKSSSKLVVRTNELASEWAKFPYGYLDLRGERKEIEDEEIASMSRTETLSACSSSAPIRLCCERNRAFVELRKRVRPRWIFRERRHFFGWIERKKKKRRERNSRWNFCFEEYVHWIYNFYFPPAILAASIFDSVLSNVDRILLGKKVLRFVTGRGNQTLLNIQKGR